MEEGKNKDHNIKLNCTYTHMKCTHLGARSLICADMDDKKMSVSLNNAFNDFSLWFLRATNWCEVMKLLAANQRANQNEPSTQVVRYFDLPMSTDNFVMYNLEFPILTM